MTLDSLDFTNNDRIPVRFTCDGENLSPNLIIEGVPAEAESLVLIVTDPDAPLGVWTHWLVWNISPKRSEFEQGVVPDEAIEGVNSSGSQGYQGPCPPNGVHHYVFKLHALDIELDLDGQAQREEVLTEMYGHVLEEAELKGVYSR